MNWIVNRGIIVFCFFYLFLIVNIILYVLLRVRFEFRVKWYVIKGKVNLKIFFFGYEYIVIDMIIKYKFLLVFIKIFIFIIEFYLYIKSYKIIKFNKVNYFM